MLKQQITLQVQQPHTSPLTPRLLTCTPVSPSPLRALACPYYSLDLFAKANWILIWVTRKFQIRILIRAETALSLRSHPHSPSTESVCRILYTIYIPYPDCWILYPESDCSVRSTVRRQWQTFLLCFNVSFGASSFLPCAFFLLLCSVVVPFVVLIVVVVAAVVEYLYLLQVFVCRFTASISIFGPSSAAGSNSAEIPFCPLWHGRVLIPFNGLYKYKTTRQALHWLKNSRTAFVLASQWT